jgi:hypothetical protein
MGRVAMPNRNPVVVANGGLCVMGESFPVDMQALIDGLIRIPLSIGSPLNFVTLSST